MSSSSKPAAGMAPAAAALAEVEKLINDEAQASNPDMKKRKNRIRHILSNVNKAMGVLERVADVHPATQVVFIVFKGLLKLEMDRRENSEHIVVLYHPMARMLSVLSHLEQIVLDSEDDPVTQHLAEVLSSVAQTMEEFGDLSDLYYNKCKQPIVRFLKAGDFKKKIEDFHDRFAKHRKEIQEALVLRNEFRGKEMSEEIERLRVNTEKIIARLGEPSSDQEVKALEIVRQYGKDYILHDKVKLEEVSALVGGGKVSGHTQALLDTSIDSLLASNMDQFHRKLESSMNQITDSINKSRDAILKKLDSGPHELIEDPDVKTVWQSNGWKLSVKCRHFVDELSNHYEEKFRNEATEDEPKDRWTLPIFSKVMYHPAIGDAIDEDGSGFISIYEVNSFLTSRPEGWTLTEWLVYWAIGWRMNCVRYNESLMDSLGDIRDKCESLIQSGDENIKHHVQQYLQKIQILDKVVLWSENENAQIEDTQDLSPESEEKLQNLLDQISDKQVAELKTRLDELKWLLDDPADIPVLLGGADARVEQVFLCIADLILGRQLEDLTTKQIEDGDWEIMTETLHMLIGVFHERMQSLLRGWRAQKLNVDLNITCFAGGVYSGWHAAYFNPNGEMKRLLEKKPNNGQASSQNNSQADALATLLIQMNNLTERVDNMDSRMDDLFTMMKTLLQTSVAKPNDTPKPEKRESTAQKPTQKPIQEGPSQLRYLFPQNVPKPQDAPNHNLGESTGVPRHPVPTPLVNAHPQINGVPHSTPPNHGPLIHRVLPTGDAKSGAGNGHHFAPRPDIHANEAIPRGRNSENDDFDAIVDSYSTPPKPTHSIRAVDTSPQGQTAAGIKGPEMIQTSNPPEPYHSRYQSHPEVPSMARRKPVNGFSPPPSNRPSLNSNTIDFPRGQEPMAHEPNPRSRGYSEGARNRTPHGSPMQSDYEPPTSAGSDRYASYRHNFSPARSPFGSNDHNLTSPVSAGVVEGSYSRDQRPMTAPSTPHTDTEAEKKLKHKKSGGIKGVKDSIREIGRGTRTRLASFSSKKSSETTQEDKDSSERSHDMPRVPVDKGDSYDFTMMKPKYGSEGPDILRQQANDMAEFYARRVHADPGRPQGGEMRNGDGRPAHVGSDPRLWPERSGPNSTPVRVDPGRQGWERRVESGDVRGDRRLAEMYYGGNPQWNGNAAPSTPVMRQQGALHPIPTDSSDRRSPLRQTRWNDPQRLEETNPPAIYGTAL